MGKSKNWYDTSFIFPIGVLVGLNEDKMNQILKNKYCFKLVVVTILFVITFLLNYSKEGLIFVAIRSVAAITFTILFILMIMKMDLSDNKISVFMGSISFELYLIHDRLLNILDINGYIYPLSLVVYFILIILLSILLKKVCNIIYRIN